MLRGLTFDPPGSFSNALVEGGTDTPPDNCPILSRHNSTPSDQRIRQRRPGFKDEKVTPVPHTKDVSSDAVLRGRLYDLTPFIAVIRITLAPLRRCSADGHWAVESR